MAHLLESMADETPDLMATFAPISWQMQWANPALRDWLHIPAWASPPLVELLDEQSQGHFVVKVLPNLLSQGWWQGELHLVGPDVEPIVTSSTLVAYRAVGRRDRSLVLTAQRVRTDQTRRQRRSQDEQFAALVEHVSDLIAVVEPGGTIRYASPAATAMLGYRPGELTDTALVELLHPEDQAEDIAGLVRVDDDGNGEPVSLRLRASDGSWRFIEAVVSATSPRTLHRWLRAERPRRDRPGAGLRAAERSSSTTTRHRPAQPAAPVDRVTTLLETRDARRHRRGAGGPRRLPGGQRDPRQLRR